VGERELEELVGCIRPSGFDHKARGKRGRATEGGGANRLWAKKRRLGHECEGRDTWRPGFSELTVKSRGGGLRGRSVASVSFSQKRPKKGGAQRRDNGYLKGGVQDI